MKGMKEQPFLTRRTRFDGTGLIHLRNGKAREAARFAELAVRYEDLLDQVWRCEREWKLDDRIAYTCRTDRRRPS